MRHKNLNTPEKRARVGERIKLAATTAGLSLKDLAEQAGTSQALIYQYVRGITAIPMPVLESIAAVCRVHTDFFDPEKDARSTLALPADRQPQDGDSPATTASEAATRARIQSEMRRLYELAEAYNQPRRSRSTYISTLDQMLALARTLEDRRQEAWILWQLGRAKIQDSNLEEAKQHLLQAREMFAQEKLDTYHFHVTQDLVLTLSEQGAFHAAQTYLEESLEKADRDGRWRTLIMLGSLHYRQNEYGSALRYFSQAAEQLEQVDTEMREQEGLPNLMASIADVVRATGHYEEAMLLWSRCLQQATIDRRTDYVIETLMEVAQCCQLMGKITEARKNLEMAVTLASFLFEDEASLGIAQALLASVLVALGSLDEARDRARASLKIANKVRGARPTILATLALTETSLASGQWENALDYSQEALDEAKRTGRTREVAQAHEMRARAYLIQFEDAQAQKALSQAYAEASRALDLATRADSVRERASAHFTTARCCYYSGNTEGAEREAREALQLLESGAVSLPFLMGQDAEHLPALLRSEELNLPELFAGRKLTLPALEWQAHYLQGTAQAKRLGPEAAFEAMREATKTITGILNGLTPEETLAFQRRYPEVSFLVRDLQRTAITEAHQQEARALLTGTALQFAHLPALSSSAS